MCPRITNDYCNSAEDKAEQMDSSDYNELEESRLDVSFAPLSPSKKSLKKKNLRV